MLAYVEAITSSNTMEDVWPIHCDAMAEFGFNRILYGLTWTRSRDQTSLGPRDDFLVLTNLDETYTGPFVDQGLYKHAPMMRWVLRNTGAMSWGWLRDQVDNLTEEEKLVMAFNNQQGVRSGYSVSFQGVDKKSVAAIALMADPDVSQDAVDAMWKEHGRTIVAMNNVLHLKVVQLPDNAVRKTLTNRQRETLEWVGEGKPPRISGSSWVSRLRLLKNTFGSRVRRWMWKQRLRRL